MSGDREKQPIVPLVMARMAVDCARLSPTLEAFDTVAAEMSKKWSTDPNWSDAQLGAIKSPVWIVDGDHEEFIKREHTQRASTIPGAGLMILPNASHFAPLQAPMLFNAAVLQFLDSEPKNGQ